MKDLEALLVMSITGLEAMGICKAASIQFVVQNTRELISAKWELLQLGNASCVSTICLSVVTALDQISQVFPSSDQRLEWERGYSTGPLTFKQHGHDSFQ